MNKISYNLNMRGIPFGKIYYKSKFSDSNKTSGIKNTCNRTTPLPASHFITFHQNNGKYNNKG